MVGFRVWKFTSLLMDCIMEGHAGPVGGEMRPPGVHPSCGTVSQVSLSAQVCRWVAGRKAEATATASPQRLHGTCGHSHSHSWVHPVDVCWAPTMCQAPTMCPSTRWWALVFTHVPKIVDHLLCARNWAKCWQWEGEHKLLSHQAPLVE